MNKPKSIAQILAELVVQGNMPLKAVAIAGELITVDAQVSDYPSGPVKQMSLDEILHASENYDLLLRQIEATQKEFVETQDRTTLMQNLVKAKNMIKNMTITIGLT